MCAAPLSPPTAKPPRSDPQATIALALDPFISKVVKGCNIFIQVLSEVEAEPSPRKRPRPRFDNHNHSNTFVPPSERPAGSEPKKPNKPAPPMRAHITQKASAPASGSGSGSGATPLTSQPAVSFVAQGVESKPPLSAAFTLQPSHKEIDPLQAKPRAKGILKASAKTHGHKDNAIEPIGLGSGFKAAGSVLQGVAPFDSDPSEVFQTTTPGFVAGPTNALTTASQKQASSAAAKPTRERPVEAKGAFAFAALGDGEASEAKVDRNISRIPLLKFGEKGVSATLLSANPPPPQQRVAVKARYVQPPAGSASGSNIVPAASAPGRAGPGTNAMAPSVFPGSAHELLAALSKGDMLREASQSLDISGDNAGGDSEAAFSQVEEDAESPLRVATTKSFGLGGAHAHAHAQELNGPLFDGRSALHNPLDRGYRGGDKTNGGRVVTYPGSNSLLQPTPLLTKPQASQVTTVQSTSGPGLALQQTTQSFAAPRMSTIFPSAFDENYPGAGGGMLQPQPHYSTTSHSAAPARTDRPPERAASAGYFSHSNAASSPAGYSVSPAVGSPGTPGTHRGGVVVDLEESDGDSKPRAKALGSKPRIPSNADKRIRERDQKLKEQELAAAAKKQQKPRSAPLRKPLEVPVDSPRTYGDIYLDRVAPNAAPKGKAEGKAKSADIKDLTSEAKRAQSSGVASREGQVTRERGERGAQESPDVARQVLFPAAEKIYTQPPKPQSKPWRNVQSTMISMDIRTIEQELAKLDQKLPQLQTLEPVSEPSASSAKPKELPPRAPSAKAMGSGKAAVHSAHAASDSDSPSPRPPNSWRSPHNPAWDEDSDSELGSARVKADAVASLPRPNSKGSQGAKKPSKKISKEKPAAVERSNKNLVKNAIQSVCLAGGSCTEDRNNVLNKLAESDSKHFVIVFKKTRNLLFKGLCAVSEDGEATKLFGDGPDALMAEDVDTFFKYDCAAKQFVPLRLTKFSPTVDAVCLRTALLAPPRKPSY